MKTENNLRLWTFGIDHTLRTLRGICGQSGPSFNNKLLQSQDQIYQVQPKLSKIEHKIKKMVKSQNKNKKEESKLTVLH